MGWTDFINTRRNRGDFPNTFNFQHPAKRLLQNYKNRGAPVKLHTPPWSPDAIKKALIRGAHRSCNEQIEFLSEEFVDMINKEQWVVFPFDRIKHLPGLRLSPPGVIPQRGRRPRWICDYTWSGVNKDTLPLAPQDAMQFGHALDRYLRELLLADPALGKLYLSKLDISDGFYRVNLNVEDILKLAVVFPTRPGETPLVAFPLVLPMGWKNSPPVFCAVTETAADLANTAITSQIQPLDHPLEAHAALLDDPQFPSSPSSPPQEKFPLEILPYLQVAHPQLTLMFLWTILSPSAKDLTTDHRSAKHFSMQSTLSYVRWISTIQRIAVNQSP